MAREEKKEGNDSAGLSDRTPALGRTPDPRRAPIACPFYDYALTTAQE